MLLNVCCYEDHNTILLYNYYHVIAINGGLPLSQVIETMRFISDKRFIIPRVRISYTICTPGSKPSNNMICDDCPCPVVSALSGAGFMNRCSSDCNLTNA